MKEKLKNLPSFVYVILIPLALIVLIGTIVGIFIALATVEGIASAVMILAGFYSFKLFAYDSIVPGKKPAGGAGIWIACGIVFFALMGMSVDQNGNYFYNKPMEWIFCPAGTSLNRAVEVLNPLPGTTYMIQDFSCYTPEGEFKKAINVLELVAFRFIEYILIGYILLYLARLSNRGKKL